MSGIIQTGGKRELTEREKIILRKIVHLYILKAAPIGSRFLARNIEAELKLSPATLRNVMADLEELEFITHPHTSAGRVPTDKGYRFYVDNIMSAENLTELEITALQNNLASAPVETVLKEASKVLGLISRFLGMVKIPQIHTLLVHKIEFVKLASDKLLAVLALDSNIVRTVTLEADFEIEDKYLDAIKNYINEKISGKPLNYIRENFNEMLADIDRKMKPLIRLFVDSVDRVFSRSLQERIILTGAQNLLDNPEFEDLSRVRSVIELIENEDMIIHLLDRYESEDRTVKILIGSEMQSNLLDEYSIVLTNYRFGSAQGSVGLIGPKRMNYPKMISLVNQVANIITENRI